MATYSILKALTKAEIETLSAIGTVLELLRAGKLVSNTSAPIIHEHLLQIGNHIPNLQECIDMLDARQG